MTKLLQSQRNQQFKILNLRFFFTFIIIKTKSHLMKMNYKCSEKLSGSAIQKKKIYQFAQLRRQEKNLTKQQFQDYLNLGQDKRQNDSLQDTDHNTCQFQEDSFNRPFPNFDIQDNYQNILTNYDNSLSSEMESQMDQIQNTDSKMLFSASKTTNYQFEQTVRSIERLHKTILQLKQDGNCPQKELKQIIQEHQSFCKKLKLNTKIQADPQKNYPRDKYKYIFQIMMKKYNQEISIILNQLQENDKNKTLKKIKQIAQKGCWQKTLNNLLQINSFAFQKLILEAMQSGEVQKKIEQSRKDTKVKELYQKLFIKDLEIFRRQIEKKDHEKNELICMNISENQYEDSFL